MTEQPIERRPGDFDPRALRQLRTKAGMTQEGLAVEVGVSDVRICQLENVNVRTEPSRHLFRALVNALGVRPEQLEVPAGETTERAKATAETSAA